VSEGAKKWVDSVWRERATGRLWRTVGFVTDPSVIIEPVDGLPGLKGARQTHVLGSRNLAEQFEELRPVKS
jgi:hypothetical protein